jgi:cytochrome c551/c552
MRSLQRLVVLVPLVASIALAGACGGTDAAGPGTGGDGGASTITPVAPDGVAGALPCDVDAVLAANCRKCHDSSTKYGAPMPLVTAADLHAAAVSNPGRRVYELVPERIADDAKPMPQPPNPRLSEADRATLTSWAAAGAPAGTAQCNTAPPKPDVMTTCKPDLPIGPASEYVMPASTGDEYVCYGVELTRPTPTQVVGFAPRIDNTSIVHHVVLYEAESAVSATPTPCSASGSLKWHMVTGWAPGGKGFELPPEAGFPLKTSGATHYVVQVHYSNPQALANQKDKSGFDLCTSAPRKYEADVVAFGTQKIKIPAGATMTANCKVTIVSQFAGLHLIAAMPHMHKLGTDMTTELLAGGPSGAATDLGTVKGWNFNTQAWLEIKGDGTGAGAVTKTNDVVRTKCTWKNTTGAEVSFGENTADEMCYSFTTYYPRIVAPQGVPWSWAYPAAASQCTYE